MGRLFDAVSGLLNLRSSVNYEGQAAIELEGIADPLATELYEFRIEGEEIFAEPVIQRAVEDLLQGAPAGQISARFHLSVARLILNVARRVREEQHLNRVVVSGGVFQNMWLLDRVTQLLRKNHFEIFSHSRVPTNDGGISLGQAAVANARLRGGRAS
jgi:hydrogenase maturation protein HypF